MVLPHNVLFIHINSPVNKTSASTYANIFQSFRTKVMPIPIHAINLSTDPRLPLSHAGSSPSLVLQNMIIWVSRLTISFDALYTWNIYQSVSARHPLLNKSFQKSTVPRLWRLLLPEQILSQDTFLHLISLLLGFPSLHWQPKTLPAYKKAFQITTNNHVT